MPNTWVTRGSKGIFHSFCITKDTVSQTHSLTCPLHSFHIFSKLCRWCFSFPANLNPPQCTASLTSANLSQVHEQELYHSQGELCKYDKEKNIALHGGILFYLKIYIFYGRWLPAQSPGSIIPWIASKPAHWARVAGPLIQKTYLNMWVNYMLKVQYVLKLDHHLLISELVNREQTTGQNIG